MKECGVPVVIKNKMWFLERFVLLVKAPWLE